MVDVVDESSRCSTLARVQSLLLSVHIEDREGQHHHVRNSSELLGVYE